MKNFSLLQDIVQEADLEDSERQEFPTLEKIIGEIMLPEEGTIRALVFLPKRDLTTQYLVSGGGGKVIDSMPREELENTALEINGKVLDSSRPGPRISLLNGRNFLFKDLLIPASGVSARPDAVVLIDVPSSTIAEAKSAATKVGAISSEQDIDAFKESLKKMMSHKFYVATLYIEKAKKIQDKIVRTAEVLEWIKHFDPAIILNYPNKNDLIAARDEWDDMTDIEKREIEKLELRGEREERKRAAREKISPSGVNEDLKNRILTVMLNNPTATAVKIAEILKSSLKSSYPDKNDVIAAIENLEKIHSGVSKMADIKTALIAMSSW